MAPPRHKRGRSSTSSRASANLQKTEVTINVYDLLPVSQMRVVAIKFAVQQIEWLHVRVVGPTLNARPPSRLRTKQS
jgi:hypothetical protein